MTILEVLRQEHANTVRLLRTLEWQVAEFKIGNQPDYDVLCAAVDYFLTFPDLSHHPTEDLIFEKLRDRAPDTAASIGDLRTAHDELAARAKEFAAGLRAVLAEAELPREAFVRWACGFIDHQRQHLEMEEATFFPAAEKMLTEKDWNDLQVEVAKRHDPLFDAKPDEKFERLRQTILTWQMQDEALRADDP